MSARCPHSDPLKALGDGALVRGDIEVARADVSEAIRFAPDNA